MGNFNKNRRGGGRNDFKRKDKQMFDAVCDNCGHGCQVPFKPSGGKPVYCNDCFKTMGPQKNRDSFRKQQFSDKKMFEAVCAKCGTKCEVPFRPTEGKPVYCNNCFTKNSSPAAKASGDLGGQLAAINSKLDSILKFLNRQDKEPVKPAKDKDLKKTAKKPVSPKKKVLKKKK
ncbi:hypothetical protein C4569_00085 [Candidatus Parcubacteria bacterium]|nr:MAG: hypothetical protein C4569_00085 [Candidatus Parcubacteria bacterium]